VPADSISNNAEEWQTRFIWCFTLYRSPMTKGSPSFPGAPSFGDRKCLRITLN
jgi:hypothetical protein